MLSAALSLVCGAGAHLHLCFDGLEPPATLHHLTDGRDHLNHHGPEQGHSDSDVGFDASLSSSAKKGADGSAIETRVVDASAGVRSTVLLRALGAPSDARTPPQFRQPPLRAPPA